MSLIKFRLDYKYRDKLFRIVTLITYFKIIKLDVVRPGENNYQLPTCIEHVARFCSKILSVYSMSIIKQKYYRIVGHVQLY